MAVSSFAPAGDGSLTVTTRPCGFCGKPGVVSVPQAGFFAWAKDGVLIQDAMPDIPKERREQLISGTCPDCWRRYFGSPPVGPVGPR